MVWVGQACGVALLSAELVRLLEAEASHLVVLQYLLNAHNILYNVIRIIIIILYTCYNHNGRDRVRIIIVL